MPTVTLYPDSVLEYIGVTCGTAMMKATTTTIIPNPLLITLSNPKNFLIFEILLRFNKFMLYIIFMLNMG